MAQINRAYFGITNSPGTTGNFTVGAAVTGPYRTLGAAQNGQSFEVSIVEGNTWEIRTGCTYTDSTKTLTRGTFEDSSSGSAINFGTGALVMVTSTAARANLLELEVSRGVTLVGNGATETTSIGANSVAKISMSFVESNPNNWWVTATQRFQPNRPGYYFVRQYVQLSIASPTSNHSMSSFIRKNGAASPEFAAFFVTYPSGASESVATGADIILLNGTSDYLELYAYQNSSLTRTTLQNGTARRGCQATFAYLGQ